MLRPVSFLALLVVLAPAGERVVERRFTSELELTTDSFELVGSEDGRTAEQQGPHAVLEQRDEIEIEDTLHDEQDPPARFTRLYRTVADTIRISGEDAPSTRTSNAGVEGKSVTFEREEDGSFARSTADEGVRKGQLKRLRADLSLACFLPPSDALGEEGEGQPADGLEPGTEWEISCADLARLFSPLEEGPPRPRRRAAPKGGLNVAPAALSEPMSILLAAAEGTMSATLLEPDEDDELPHGARLEFRIESTFDGSANMLASLPEEVRAQAEAEDELELVWEGTGRLAWGEGRIEIACQGELRMSEAFAVRVEAQGKSGTIGGRLAVSGTLELTGSEQQE